MVRKARLQSRGVGAGLFEMIRGLLERSGARHTIASIRTDNMPRLACHARAGFALTDRRVVRRNHRRFSLV